MKRISLLIVVLVVLVGGTAYGESLLGTKIIAPGEMALCIRLQDALILGKIAERGVYLDAKAFWADPDMSNFIIVDEGTVLVVIGDDEKSGILEVESENGDRGFIPGPK